MADNIFSRLAKRFTGSNNDNTALIQTKKPGFAIAQYNTNTSFLDVIEREENYFQQYILYVARSIDYISNKVASAELNLYDSSNKTINDNTLFTQLEAFNPYMSLWEARKLKEMHLMLTGAAAWYIDRSPEINEQFELYPLNPTDLQVKTDGSGLPAYYEYTDADGRIVELPYEDVIYFKRMNPENWLEGLSTVKSMLFWSNAYAQGAQYNMNKLGNNANVDKFLVFEGISDEQKERVEAQMANKYGGVRNAGRTGILKTRPEVIEMSQTQKDMDYVEGMKMLRQDILTGFGIPEALLFPSATNANTKDAIRIFQQDTLDPLLKQEEAALNEQLIRKLEGVKRGSFGVYFRFDNIVDADKDALVSQVVELVKTGVYTRNQALEYIGDEPVEGGDIYLSEGSVSQVIEESKAVVEKYDKLNKGLQEEIDKAVEMDFTKASREFATEQEGIFFTTSEALFQDQYKRLAEYIENTDKVRVREAWDNSSEVELTKQVFKSAYDTVIDNSNTVANNEIKQKLYKYGSPKFVTYKKKELSVEALEEIDRKLDYFSNEISGTTAKKLRKIIAQGVDAGFNQGDFQEAIKLLFNGFIDGAGNVDVLTKLGVYAPSAEYARGEFNTSGPERYQSMYKSLLTLQEAGEITREEMTDGMLALRGLMDESSPIAIKINEELDRLGINKDAGVSESRVIAIARTESTFARNLGFYDTYTDNPFVVEQKWNDLGDSDVRSSHRSVEPVAVGEPFDVNGSKMRFPGDTSLGAPAKEVVNCRCRITAGVSL